MALLIGSISLGSVAWIACGGSDQTNSLLSPDPDAGAGADGSNISADSSVADSASPVDSGDAGTPTPEAGGGDGGSNPPDAGPGGGGTTIISCGATTCAIPAQSCCVERVGGATNFGCFTGAACPAVDAGVDVASLKCSSQANCAAGTVCCATQVGNGNAATSQCAATCTGGNTAQLCDPNAAGGVTGCPAVDGGACSSKNISDWGLPATYATCGGKQN
jgi:hypothetical protein